MHLTLNWQKLDDESPLNFSSYTKQIWNKFILQVKFVNHPCVKFNFENIIDCKTEAGCQNLMYNLLNQNHSK